MSNEEKILAILKDGAALRGLILNQVITIERMIDEFLSSYFCDTPEKKKSLMENLISEFLTFDLKRQVFENVVDPNFIKENPLLISNLILLMKHRNVVAHWIMDTSDEGLKYFDKGERAFIRFKTKTKNTPNTKVYNQKTINDILKKAEETIKSLSALILSKESSNPGSGATSGQSTNP